MSHTGQGRPYYRYRTTTVFIIFAKERINEQDRERIEQVAHGKISIIHKCHNEEQANYNESL